MQKAHIPTTRIRTRDLKIAISLQSSALPTELWSVLAFCPICVEYQDDEHSNHHLASKCEEENTCRMWKPWDFNRFTNAMVILEAVPTANCCEKGLVPKQMSDFGPMNQWDLNIRLLDCSSNHLNQSAIVTFFSWSQKTRAQRDPVWTNKDAKKMQKKQHVFVV